MNLMQQYIREQPETLRALVDGRETLAHEFCAKFGKRQIDRVVLLGSGSSYHAALMAKPLIERALGAEVSAVVPTRFDDLAAMRKEDVLYLASSQSGRSTNTYERMGRLRSEGQPVAAVTADGASPVGRAADVTVCPPIGEELIGAKTKGMTATAVTLILLALELGRVKNTLPDGFYDEALAALAAMCDAMAENIARAERWCVESAVPLLAPAGYLDVIAEGADYAAALEGRLKLLETIWRPVVCYEFEEYLHGIQNALGEQTYLLGLLPADEDEAARMRRLAAFARDKGAKCLLIGLETDPGEGGLTLQRGGQGLSGFDYLPAMQTLSALLSAHCGIDVTRPRFPDFYAIMKSKL